MVAAASIAFAAVATVSALVKESSESKRFYRLGIPQTEACSLVAFAHDAAL